MKSFLFAFLALCLVQGASAQTTAVTTFIDLAEAKAYAAENNQDILMVFAGSDWCKPCIQFKKDILQSSLFESQVGQKITILYLDFPARRKNKLSKEQTAHNEALAERFNKSGAFPKIILLDVEENLLASPSFKGQSANEFIDELKPSLTSDK